MQKLGFYKTTLLGLISTLTLSACQGGRFDTRGSTQLVLPAKVQYSREFRDELRQEAERVKRKEPNACYAHVSFGQDHVWLRDKIEIARKELQEE